MVLSPSAGAGCRRGLGFDGRARAVGVDAGAQLCGIVLRDQALDRHVDDIGDRRESPRGRRRRASSPRSSDAARRASRRPVFCERKAFENVEHLDQMRRRPRRAAASRRSRSRDRSRAPARGRSPDSSSDRRGSSRRRLRARRRRSSRRSDRRRRRAVPPARSLPARWRDPSCTSRSPSAAGRAVGLSENLRRTTASVASAAPASSSEFEEIALDRNAVARELRSPARSARRA